MKRVLFVSAHFPSLKSRYAGHKTAFRNLAEYDVDSQVDLIIVSNADEADHSALQGLKNTRLVRFEPLTGMKKVKNILASGKYFPMKVMSRYSPAVNDFIREKAAAYDILHFEFTHAASPLPFVAKEKLGRAKLVVSSHDILIQGKLRKERKGLFAKVVDGFDVSETFGFEDAIYALADEILVQSPKDKKLIESLYAAPGSKVRVIDPYISEFTRDVFKSRCSGVIHPKTLLFWGAMNRGENEEAVLAFVQRFGQRLKEGGYTLYVVGNAPSERVKRLASEHLVVTGFVEDPSPFFLRAEIGVVPLLAGAGIKVKTLEMLRSGIPVISTAVGAEGIEDPQLHVADLDSFMMQIESLHARLRGNG